MGAFALSRIAPLRPRPPDGSPRVDENDLVRRAIDGQVWAQSELFKQYAPGILALLTRLLSSHADAEDSTQDTFVIAFRDLRQLREPAAFPGWLRQIAVHQAQHRIRRRKVLAIFSLDGAQDAPLDELADPGAPPEERAELALLNRLLQQLPAADRTAWMLRYVEGYELTEVAELCGCSLATAKRRIAAARERISRHLEIKEGSDE